MSFHPLERKLSTLENYIQETRELSALGMFEFSPLGWSLLGEENSWLQ